MRNSLIFLTALALAGGTAAAQNESAPVVGRMTGWEDGPSALRPVTFVALGTYSDQGERRQIDVSVQADRDGDGSNDVGVLSITCNGGDILSGVFAPAGKDRAVKAAKAPAASPLGQGKTFDGKWDAAQTLDGSPPPAAVTLGSDPDVCAALG